ncbi:MAG: TetR/AcrR family transcriptional regulator [Eubacteriales bacterium]|nr:TetR/AcrR family transcriptional regulator [Eubacteriales bacterium]
MYKKGLNREAIVDAAAALAEQNGMENITLRELAEALGVKTASLYNHLQGLPELNARLAERALDRLTETLSRALEGRTGAEALRALALAYRAFAHSQPQLYRAMLALPRFADNRLAELKNSFMQLFRAVLAPYGLPDSEQVHLSRAIRSALHGYVSLEAAGFFRSPAAAADDSFDRMVERLCREIEGMGAAAHG